MPGGLLPGAAQGDLDGEGFAPGVPARLPAAQAALSDARPARGRLVSEWNLVVPLQVLERSRQEVA